MLVSVICGIFWAIENSANPYILKYIVDTISSYDGSLERLWEVLLIPVCLYACFWVIRTLSIRIAELGALKTYPPMSQDITVQMFSYLKDHSFQYFQNNFAGSLQNKISDMAAGSTAIVRKVEEAIAQCIMVVIAIITMSVVHPFFGMVLTLWLILFIGIAIVFSNAIRKRAEDFSESRSRHVGKIVDSISNVLNSRLFAMKRHEVGVVKNAVSESCGKEQSMQGFILRVRLMWDLTFVGLMVGMIILLIHMYQNGEVTIGDFIFIMGLSRAVVYPVWWLATQMIEFSGDVGKCQQALKIITPDHDVTDDKNASELIVTKGEINFNEVNFDYHKNSNVFKDVSVSIPAGQKVGLVGFSGAGKSTFVNLLLRFYDVGSGNILIDGQSIDKVSQDSLRSNISMIPQDTSLFHRSLMENIRYGRSEASDEEVINAAKQAFCHGFIQELPEKYDALVGERGVKLSGGQRQRIAIARAILKDAPILILDEATSALDSVTEKYIQQGLDTLMEKRTAIVIAHRLSTLSQMDRILVFDKGQVIEDGTHEELLQQDGHYANMWNMQAGGFLLKE